MTSTKQMEAFNVVDESAYRRQKNRATILWILTTFTFLLFLGSFVIWYGQRKHIFVFTKVTDGPKFTSTESPDQDRKVCGSCSYVPDSEKFDCFPEGQATEKTCLARGCCYKHSQKAFDKKSLTVPSCYYPTNYNGYSVVSTAYTSRHITVLLKRNIPSGFPKDITDLSLVVTFIDDNTIRVKVTDANLERFEVPVKINRELKPLTSPAYSIKVDANNNLIINRKATGTVIFKASLSRLVYSDQFIQLSNLLPSPYLYGIGESYGPVLRNMNWNRITLLNSDRSPVPNYPLYGSHPFYVSLEPNGNANGVFLLNSNPMDVILQPTPAITFRPIGGILDMYVLLGPTPANVVQQYTDLVGKTFMPPYWSLGFQMCRWGYNSLNKTKETLQRNMEAGIPIDVQWNDIDYMDRFKDFTYDEENFAGLPEFVEELHSKGMRYVVMVDPGVSNSEKPGTYPPYDNGVRDNIFMKNPNGSIFVGKVWNDGHTVFPDFSHPGASEYWLKLFQDFYGRIKYDGVWIDMNEPANFFDGGVDGCPESSFEDPPYLPGSGEYKLRRKTACMTARHYDTIHYNEHNLLAYREAIATNQALRKIRNQRPFIISRASFAGQGVHSGHWSGDIASTWEDMRYSIPSAINFNMYGVSMIGSDICGFIKNTTVELCARWQALGAFYPFSRNHNTNDTFEQDPAILGSTVVDAAKNALNQRYWLLPYLYTLFYRSHAFGDTVIRPTFFEFSQDKNTYAQDEQFLWGPALMIIPALYPGVNTVTTYLPKGLWYHGPNPEVIASPGANYTFDSTISSIVVAVRGGYILPSQINGQTTTESRKNNFVVAVALDENQEAKGELYWDDGDSLETYEKGEYNLIEFSAEKKTIKSKVVKNDYKKDEMKFSNIQLAGVNPAPTQVTFNGANCIKRADLNETNEMPHRKLSWLTRYSQNTIPDEATCVFTPIPPVGVAIGFNPTSLLNPFEVTWK